MFGLIASITRCEEKFIGEEVLVLASLTQVSLYHGGKLIEIHDRILANDPSRSKSTKPHHRKPWERELENGSLYRKRAAILGLDAERFVVELLKQGDGFINTRKIWGILSLDKTFTAPQINEACRQALELGTLSYRMVKSLLKLNGSVTTVNPTGSSSLQENHKFVRPMSVYAAQASRPGADEEQLTLLH